MGIPNIKEFVERLDSKVPEIVAVPYSWLFSGKRYNPNPGFPVLNLLHVAALLDNGVTRVKSHNWIGVTVWRCINWKKNY